MVVWWHWRCPYECAFVCLEWLRGGYHELVMVWLLDEFVPRAKVLVNELNEFVLKERHRQRLDEINEALDLGRVGT